MSSCPLLLDFGAMPTNPFGRLALARRTHGTAIGGITVAGWTGMSTQLVLTLCSNITLGLIAYQQH